MVGMDCCRSFTGRRTRGSLALSLHGVFRVQLGHASRPNLSCNCSVRGGRTIGLARDDTTNLKSADSCKAVAHNGLCPVLAQTAPRMSVHGGASRGSLGGLQCRLMRGE